MPAGENCPSDEQQDQARQRKDQPVDTAGADLSGARLALATDAQMAVDGPADHEATQDRGELE